MPAKKFLFPQSIQKHAQRLPNQIKHRIPSAIELLKLNPIAGVKLHGELAGFYKYRLGDYRIIYTFDVKTSTVEVIAIEHRQGVYK